MPGRQQAIGGKMKTKTKRVYENIEEFMEAMNSGKIKVGDELVTRDIQGKAKFVVANIEPEKKAILNEIILIEGLSYNVVSMVRKYALEDPKPIKSKDFDLFKWLNNEYYDSFPIEVRKRMIDQDGRHRIDLPMESEVFGKNEYGVPEKWRQWEYFKNTKNRICTTKKDDEYSHWWWLGTQHRASAASFCTCVNLGYADYYGASYAYRYVRPRFILAQRNR